MICWTRTVRLQTFFWHTCY